MSQDVKLILRCRNCKRRIHMGMIWWLDDIDKSSVCARGDVHSLFVHFPADGENDVPNDS